MDRTETLDIHNPVTGSGFSPESIQRLELLQKMPAARLLETLSGEGNRSIFTNTRLGLSSSVSIPDEGRVGSRISFQEPPRPQPRVQRFLLEQQFEGAVTAVLSESRTFMARLIDLTGARPEEEVEMAFDEISPDDRPLIVPGALFTWDIGMEQDRSRQVQRVSKLRFRRIPRFSDAAIKRAKANAQVTLESLNEPFIPPVPSSGT